MKKILVFLLSLLTVVFAASCGTGSAPDSSAPDAVADNGTDSVMSQEEETSPDSYDWTNVFSTMDLEKPFRIRFVGTKPYSCATGAVGMPVDDVVAMVDYKSTFAESDFGIVASNATSEDKIVKTFEPTFIKLAQYAISAITTYGDPHIDINEQEEVTVNGVKACKSTGVYYYYPMFSNEDDGETQLQFVSYAWFTSDGIPAYIAAIDSSEDQSKLDKCEDTLNQMMESMEEIDKSLII